MKKASSYFCILLTLSIAFVLVVTEINLNGNQEGLYLLKGRKWRLFELKDDILLGEYERVLFHVDITGPLFKREDWDSLPVTSPLIKYKWHEKTGAGFIMQFLPNRKKFLVSFGRFVDSKGDVPRGLFVGGGLPLASYKDQTVALNETGVSYYDGFTWNHIWCNANEAIISPSNQYLFPADWKFIDSKVMFDHDGELILRSTHRVELDGVPLKIDRFAYFKAGDFFFTLMIRIRNVGRSPVAYRYVYGDEPWVGNFGTSRGNVGWTRDRLYFYESRIDTSKYFYAGMFDYGNKTLPDEKNEIFTRRANFIQWMGEVQPNVAYFSNRIGEFAEEKHKVPLSSPDNRVFFLEWGPRMLQPTQSEIIMLAIGMAQLDPTTHFPVKPQLQLQKENIDFIVTHP